jgi:hypothetical protein
MPMGERNPEKVSMQYTGDRVAKQLYRFPAYGKPHPQEERRALSGVHDLDALERAKRRLALKLGSGGFAHS